jgi:cytochrome c556
MKKNRLAQLSLVLWIATVAVFAWFFVRGNTTAGADGRAAVILQPSERDFVMKEMRGMLAAAQGITEGASQNDIQRIIKAARSAGMAGTAEVNPALMTKLPIDFKTQGLSLHNDMDEIAKAAEGGKPVPELLKMTSGALAKCVACHEAWQIKAEK